MFDLSSIFQLLNCDLGVAGFAARTEQRYMGRSSVEALIKCRNGGCQQFDLGSSECSVPDQFGKLWSAAVVTLHQVPP